MKKLTMVWSLDGASTVGNGNTLDASALFI